MVLAKRLQLFEFSDLPWWPHLLRTYSLDYLLAVAERFRPFSPKINLILEAMDTVGTDRIVDLCSGVGGHWPYLAVDIARQRGEPVRLSLSDRFPDPQLEPLIADIPGASYERESVDARHVPPRLEGLRTMFNGFHHFRPDEAQRILQDAVRNGQPIAVFEMLERTWSYVAFLLLTPLLVAIITPKIRPFRLSRLLLTFVLPVIPLCMLWDSLVSAFRCYTVAELEAMVEGLEGQHYVWEAGTYRQGMLPVTYLVGYPQREPSPYL